MKANFLAIMTLCALLIAGTGIAQYGAPSEGGGYGQGGYGQPSSGGDSGNYGPNYGSPPAGNGDGQGGYGAPQGQQGYNQPNQPMQQQGGGYGNGMQGSVSQGFSPTSFASSVGGFESYRLPFERGIRTGDPASFASHLLFVSFRIALAKNKERFDLDEKCQTETGEKEVAGLLVSYYNQSGGKELATRILDNRKMMLTDLCSEDACSKQFSSDDFVRNSPPEVRKAIQNNPSLQFDATTPAAELKTKIKGICETVVESEFSNRQTQMEKQITKMTSQFSQQCTRAEQQKQQMEQQQQQWQNQQPPSGNWGPSGSGGGQGPQCPPDQYWNGTGCVQGGGQPQGPYCGDHICNEAPETCIDDCGQQGGGGGGPICGNGNCESGEDSSNCSADCGQQGGGGGGTGPVCGNGACETGEDGTGCPADCGGGGLASNVLNKMFGNKLFSITALASMLQLQGGGTLCPDGTCDLAEQQDPYLCPQDCGGSTGSGGGSGGGGQQYGNCAPGETFGINDQGVPSCLATGTSSGGGYGTQPGTGGYNQPMQQQGGYNMPPQGGGYGGGGGFGGPGFGDYSFEEMCDNPEQKIREQFSGEMEEMKRQMGDRCGDEAARRVPEILGMAEQQLLGRAECEADTAEMCSEATAVVAALEKALNNIQEPANQIANFECAKRRIAEQAQATRNEMAQAALELANLTDTGERQLGQEGVAAGSAAAMGIINQGQAVEKSKQEAGFVRWFIESPAVKEAQKAAAEALGKNLETVEDLEKQGNLTAEQQQKLEKIKEKMLAAKTTATNCQGATVLPGLFGC